MELTNEVDKYLDESRKALIKKYKNLVKDSGSCYNMIENVRTDYALFHPTSIYASYRFSGKDKSYGVVDKLQRDLPERA
ncbi:MAG: hypothetical protein LBR74_04970 [Eubacterium sp.]|nr:hypothetical protein [Eubacterium sp.]